MGDKIFKGHTVIFTDKEQRQRMDNDVSKYQRAVADLKTDIAALIDKKKAEAETLGVYLDQAKDEAKEIKRQARKILAKAEADAKARIKSLEKREKSLRFKADSIARIITDTDNRKLRLDTLDTELRAERVKLDQEEKRIEEELLAVAVKESYKEKLDKLKKKTKDLDEARETLKKHTQDTQEHFNSLAVAGKAAQAYIEEQKTTMAVISAFKDEKALFDLDKAQLVTDRDTVEAERAEIHRLSKMYDERLAAVEKKEHDLEIKARKLNEKQRKLQSGGES